MSDRVVFLFPGQGAYLPGVFAGLDADAERIMDWVAEIDDAAGEFGYEPVQPLLFAPDAPALGPLLRSDHERLDVATLATSIVFARLLDEKWDIRPNHVLGHSLGEFAALAVAGVLTPADATRAVCERHVALRKAPPPAGGMLAVNVDPTRAGELIASAGADAVAVSAHNSPEQTVLSGDEMDLVRVQEAAEKAGIRRSRLRVASSFHVQQLTDASELYAAALRKIVRSAPRERVFYSHGLGRFLTAADDVVELMVADMTRPVRFQQAVRALHDDGATRFVECGALATLTGIVSVILPSAVTIAPLRTVVTAADLSAVLEPLSPSATSAAADSDAEVLETVRAVCAEILEYPPEVITDTADFTADLGADSLTLSELLERALLRYGLEDKFHEGDPAGYATVAELAAFVAGLVRERADATAGR